MDPLSALRILHPQALAGVRAQPEGLGQTPAAFSAKDLQALAQSTSFGTSVGRTGDAPALVPLKPSPGMGETGSATSFDQVLGRLVEDVNSKQQLSGDAVNALMSGQNVSLHQAMIAMEEASVSFQLMVEVRNRLLESYQELMRMQI